MWPLSRRVEVSEAVAFPVAPAKGATAWELCPIGDVDRVLSEMVERADPGWSLWGGTPPGQGKLTALDAGLDTVTHLGLGDSRVRARAEHRVRLALQASARLGIPSVSVYAGALGYFRTDRSELVSARLHESLEHLAKLGEDLGVGLCLRLPGRGVLPGPIEARELLDAVASWTLSAELELWPTGEARLTPSWADWAATLGPRLLRIRLPVGWSPLHLDGPEGRNLTAALESTHFEGWLSVADVPDAGTARTYVHPSTGEEPHDQQQQ